MDSETSRHDCKKLAATQNINANKQIQLKITKETLIFASVVCVYWYTGLSLVCYLENIRVFILSIEIFYQILFVWQENDLVFSSELKKIAL